MSDKYQNNGRVDMPTKLRPFLVETLNPFYDKSLPVKKNKIIISQDHTRLTKSFDGSGECTLILTYSNNVGKTIYKSDIMTEGDEETELEEAKLQDLKSIADIVNQIAPRFKVEPTLDKKEKKIYIPLS